MQLGTRGSYVYVLNAAAAATASGPKAAAQTSAVAPKGQKPAAALPTGTVSLRLITVGLTTDSLTVVEKGLAAGETVIVDGLDRLRDGSKVSVAASVDTPKAEAVPVLPAQQRESAGS